MSLRRLDDVLAASALGVVALLCVSFRYLPMVDVPQHYAMVSILLHHDDPAFDFARRYTFDFVGRPYATVYWLGAALAHAMPLAAAMRIVVATCTVAPLAGAYALLAATERSRVWLLLATPFAFGSLWHWGFLNFLLGTGLFLGGLAIVVRAARAPSRGLAAALLATGAALFFTHFHGLVMLLTFAPLLAWAYLGKGVSVRALAGVLGPLVPSAVAATVFVLVTWRQAEGAWVRMNPGLGERFDRFPELLGAGLPDPWAVGTLCAFGLVAAGGFVAGDAAPLARKQLVALGLLFGAQVVLYFVLPLNTNTATYVSARHALLCILCALPLLPRLEGRRAWAVRGPAVAACFGALALVASHLACFDREARDFDGVLAAMQPNRRVASLIHDARGACVSPRTFPYLHFAAYYQAALGGELAHSFATVWNVPVRYRPDYTRYAIDDAIEWSPDRFGPRDLAHFDYVLVRGGRTQPLLGETGVREVAKSGAWTLLENTGATPADLPR